MKIPAAIRNSPHHVGRYSFEKLLFGLCSAPEVFKQIMSKAKLDLTTADVNKSKGGDNQISWKCSQITCRGNISIVEASKSK